MNTLVSRSFRLTDVEGRKRELDSITKTLKQNEYKNDTIQKVIERQYTTDPKKKEPQTKERPIAILPYLKGTTDWIGRILRKVNITSAYKPLTTIDSLLKNPLATEDLKNHESTAYHSAAITRHKLDRKIAECQRKQKNTNSTKQTDVIYRITAFLKNRAHNRLWQHQSQPIYYNSRPDKLEKQ